MVKNFRQLDERHFRVWPGQINDPTAKGLAEGVGGKVTNFYLVAHLDQFKVSVHHLIRDDAAEPVEEARLAAVTDFQSLIALADEVLETLVDSDFPTLAGFLLIDGEAIPHQEFLPRQLG